MEQMAEGADEPSWHLSRSVRTAVSSLSADVTADEFVDAILDQGHREGHRAYAEGALAEWPLAPQRTGDTRRSAEDWIEEVETLFDPERAVAQVRRADPEDWRYLSLEGEDPVLEGRLVIVGLALLEDDLRRRLRADGILETLEEEIRPPIQGFLTAAGRQRRDLGDQISPLSDDPLESAEQDRLHRSAYAAYLAERIAYLRLDSTEAISMHIYGPWGSGKTTLFNFIAEELRDRRALRLSSTISTVRDRLERRDDISADELARAVVAEVTPDAETGSRSGAGSTGARVERRSVTHWLEEVWTLFDDERARRLDARLVLIGLSMLDTDLRRQMAGDGHLAKLEDDFNPSLKELLTDRGYRRRSLIADATAEENNKPDADKDKPGLLSDAVLHAVAEGSEDREPDDAGGESAWQVVRFNAWQHQHIDPPWWALLNRVYRESKNELEWDDRLAEVGWRLSTRRLIALVGITVVVWLFVLFGLPFLLGGSLDASLGGLAGVAADVGTIIALLTSLWAGISLVMKPVFLNSANAARSYVEYTQQPMTEIQRRWNELVDRIPQHVIVFVDDLDRCESEYAVGLLEGIQTLFGDAPVVFVIAADRRWLESCFAEVYEGQSPVVRNPGKSLGGLFSEKAFQLNVPVPGVPDEVHETYWNHLIQVSPDEAESKMVDGITEYGPGPKDDVSPPGRDEHIRGRVTKWALPEVRDKTEHMLQEFALLLDRNPRAMKQLVNAYSLNRALTELTRVDVDDESLALWTILSLRWPGLATHLEKNPADVDKIDPNEDVNRYVFSGIDEELRPLFADPEVHKVVTGAPETVHTSLDSEDIEICDLLRS